MTEMLQRLKERLPLFASDTSPELRTWQWLSLIGGGAAFFIPVGHFDVSLCFFYNFSGVPCPGCGLTRSVHFALHGGWLHAFYYHPFGLLASVLIAFFVVTAFWRLPGRLFERVKRHTAAGIVVVAVGMIAFAGFRVWHLRAAIFGEGIAAVGGSPLAPGESGEPGQRDEFGYPEYTIGSPPRPVEEPPAGFEIVLDRERIFFTRPSRK